MEARNTCPACHRGTVAVNYIKNGVKHYRTVCDRCARSGKRPKTLPPNWMRSGYKKKNYCERCGFKSKLPEQIEVFYINGDIGDADWSNLKSICSNCQIEIRKSRLPWKTGDIRPDF